MCVSTNHPRGITVDELSNMFLLQIIPATMFILIQLQVDIFSRF